MINYNKGIGQYMVSITNIIISCKRQLSIYNFLKKSQEWSRKKLEKYQMDKLSRLLIHSYDNVPYYKKIFDKSNLKPRDIKSIKDLQKLPFLTRDIVRRNKEELIARNYPRNRLEYKTTSGTTGEPISFYVEKGVWLANHLAYNKIYMERAGYNKWDKMISFLGIEKESRYHPFFRTLELSSIHLLKKPDEYIKRIRKFKPKFITSYPSAAYFLSKYIREKELDKIDGIKAVFCHGEPVYEWEKKLIEEVFRCRLYDIYGHGEKSIFAGTCEKSYYYHVFSEYYVMEIVDDDGNIITEEGKTGEIVVTGLHSYAFPFIRYKTGDIGVYSADKCDCGREYPLIKRIVGRKCDFLVSRNKDLVYLIILNDFIAENSKGILMWQWRQEKVGKLNLDILVCDTFSDDMLRDIKNRFYSRFGDAFELDVNYVDDFVRRGTRKHNFLIQNLPIECRLP